MENILILYEELVRYMAKLKLNRSDLLKIKILKQLKKKDIEYTASYLSTILDAKYETVKNADMPKDLKSKALDFLKKSYDEEKEMIKDWEKINQQKWEYPASE